MDSDFSRQRDISYNADLPTMLQNVDSYGGEGLGPVIKERFPDLFSLNSDTARVDLTEEEVNALVDWLIEDLRSTTGKSNDLDMQNLLESYQTAAELLRSPNAASGDEQQLELMKALHKRNNIQGNYWGEKNRAKWLAYTLLNKLLDQKEQELSSN